MKRMTAALLVFTALSTQAWAESPTEHSMHSFDFVSQGSNPSAAMMSAPATTAEKPVPHHHKGMKHNGKHADGKKHHPDGKKHHHHMKKDKKAAEAPKADAAPKQ